MQTRKKYYTYALDESPNGEIQLDELEPEKEVKEVSPTEERNAEPEPVAIPEERPVAVPVETPEVYSPRRSFTGVPVLVGVLLLLLGVGVGAYSYFNRPQNFNQCQDFPLSEVSERDGDQICRTFWGAEFSESLSPLADADGRPRPTTTPRPDNGPEATGDVTPPPTPAPTGQVAGESTKGGEAVIEPTPAPTKAPVAQPVAPTPYPTLGPAPKDVKVALPDDWVQRSYTGLPFVWYTPKNYGSDAVRNNTTGITTVRLWPQGTEPINAPMVLTMQNNWNNTGTVRSNPVNYEVSSGIAAIKVDGSPIKVYWEQGGKVYIFSCSSAMWNTCHTILQNMRFSS